jgi:hypothetical protein
VTLEPVLVRRTGGPRSIPEASPSLRAVGATLPAWADDEATISDICDLPRAVDVRYATTYDGLGRFSHGAAGFCTAATAAALLVCSRGLPARSGPLQARGPLMGTGKGMLDGRQPWPGGARGYPSGPA